MYFRCSKTRLFIILALFVLLASCEENDVREIDVMVLSTKTEARSEPGEAEILKFAIVEYYTKNTGTNTVNGWEVFFNVHVNHGPQLVAHESTYYTLEPGEESESRIVECIIPDYYEDAYKATLRYIDTW